jgi:hypothetical protein
VNVHGFSRFTQDKLFFAGSPRTQGFSGLSERVLALSIGHYLLSDQDYQDHSQDSFSLLATTPGLLSSFLRIQSQTSPLIHLKW